ncbi:hypothetical protein DPMN_192530 [Dreissena polymorpha]|uniref:Uncharacterized protein n=1 Tax=Dreissena polymorpha TaxID=45954 RepID=A0A9D3Y704_DREPO|nr:hypothetical protein DPMN_192530 [Dreissena polymorpha]
MSILLFQNRSPTKRTKLASPEHQNPETRQPKAEPVSNAYEVFNIAVRRYLDKPSTSGNLIQYSDDINVVHPTVPEPPVAEGPEPQPGTTSRECIADTGVS